jgi:murein DD-endopeptidase MepM/ murein hydrolase activator NlpD
MAAAVAVAGGCSADVTRFNLGTFTTGAIPTPYAPTRGPAPAYAPAPQETAPPPIAPSQDYRVIGRTYDPPPVTRPYPAPSSPPPYGAPPYSAPPYTPPASKLPPYTAPPAHQEPPPAPAPPSAALAKPPPALAPSPGTATVEVRAGDTLYSIARRHGVTASALKELNDLPSMVVRPGQRLTVPSEATRDREPPVNGAPSPPFGEGTGGKAKPESAAPSDGERRHVIRDGDSLPAIAEQHKVTLEELKRANSITDQAKLRAGTVLIVPRRAEPGAGPAQGLPPRVVQVKPRIIRAPEGPSEALPQKTAGGNDMASAAAPPPAVAGGKFRWPIRGRVILAFGAQSDGAKNEGVSLAAPMGTDVQAAEAGRVHYVGDGLKGYGNLVLIRHGNDWATAYAHVDRILVKAGEEVKRGQVIAKVGKSGPVTQPQLKFELRKASVPVDPLPHLAN